MKVRFEFKLPEEHWEHQAFLKGPDAISNLKDIDDKIRGILKHYRCDKNGFYRVAFYNGGPELRIHKGTLEVIRNLIDSEVLNGTI
jgi:hypothetical protein